MLVRGGDCGMAGRQVERAGAAHMTSNERDSLLWMRQPTLRLNGNRCSSQLAYVGITTGNSTAVLVLDLASTLCTGTELLRSTELVRSTFSTSTVYSCTGSTDLPTQKSKYRTLPIIRA